MVVALSGCQLFVGSEDPMMVAIDAPAPPPPPPCPDDMLEVELIGEASNVCIDRYEASHSLVDPDVPASVAGAMPWVNVTYDEAVDACHRAGKRLCTPAEWNAACQGGKASNVYPYGEDYGLTTCNGDESNWGEALPTGSLETCQGGLVGLFDMAGNVAEWLEGCQEVPEELGGPCSPFYGRCCAQAPSSYRAGAVAQQCELWELVANAQEAYDDSGFRCCKAVDQGGA